MNVKNILRNSLLHDLVELFDSQTSESSGTIMMVPLPMRVNNQRLFQEFALQNSDRKEIYPCPLNSFAVFCGIEPPRRFWVN